MHPLANTFKPFPTETDAAITIQNILSLETDVDHETMHSSHSDKHEFTAANNKSHQSGEILSTSEQKPSATTDTGLANDLHPSQPLVNNAHTDGNRSDTPPTAEEHLLCTASIITNISGSTAVQTFQTSDDSNTICTIMTSKMQDYEPSFEVSSSHLESRSPKVASNKGTPVLPLSQDNAGITLNLEGHKETAATEPKNVECKTDLSTIANPMTTCALNENETSENDPEGEHKAASEEVLFNNDPQGSGDRPANGTNVYSLELSLKGEEEECTIPYSSTTHELDIHSSSISQENQS